ncbi:glycosyltransferase family 4 protein [Clostridium manihotivorum]|uniref:Glycosyl transferase family 1 domain-containing protein n=1 Tax=Clostridium manihotivorum TaxID=2320868 RepID=A0A410E091_9CLOT|nr:glycosyltransferase [Clostridium manihotivorum]QAA34735.1 hypothetical protein C1I91_25585 [Clostridium manihotivorum]
MKVLYVTTVPAPYKVQFFNELGKLCDLTVIFELDNVSYREKSWMETNFEHFTPIFLKGFKIRDKRISFGVISSIKKNNYDFIIIGVYSTVSQMIAQLYMKHKRIPYIISSDGGLIKQERRVIYNIKKYFIGSAQAWLSTGKTTNDYLVHYGADINRVYTYPFTSISEKDVLNEPVTNYEKGSLRKKLNIAENKVIISVGQFIYRKGYDILLKACMNLDKSIGVYIVGGKPTEEYINMQKEMKLTNVHFVDFMEKTQLAEYYKSADLFVLPTREDIWGLVVNEAMAYGLPVITTDKCVAGIEMVHEQENGALVNSDDEKQLFAAIREFMVGMNEKVSFASLNVAQKYTIESMAERHNEIFESILGEEQMSGINEKPRRVLHVIPGFGGGISSTVRNLVNSIDTNKVIIDVVSFSHYSEDFAEEIVKKSGRLFTLRKIRIRTLFRSIKEYCSILNSNEPYYAVHIHIIGFKGMYFSILARICGIKNIIIHGHATADKGSEFWYNKLKMVVSRLITRVSANRLASCSKLASQYIFGNSVVSKGKVMHIPNSINVDKFISDIGEEEKVEIKSSLNIGENSLVIAHIGQFGYQKNHDFMVNIIKRMKELNIKFVWLFIGVGKEKERIEAEISKNKCEDVTRFLGRREDVNRLLNIIDITVLPSHFEGLPTVTIESQAAGVPTVISSSITDEVDMHLGLVKYLSLEEEIDVWIKAIIEMSKVNIPDKETRIISLQRRGFTTEAAAKLYEAYIWDKVYFYNLGDEIISGVL